MKPVSRKQLEDSYNKIMQEVVARIGDNTSEDLDDLVMPESARDRTIQLLDIAARIRAEMETAWRFEQRPEVGE